MSDVEPARKSSSRLSRLSQLSRRNRQQRSTFSPSDILPQDGHKPYPNRPKSDGASDQERAFSQQGSAQQSSVFDLHDGHHEDDTEPTTLHDDEHTSFDLNAPPPKISHSNIELLASRFFSADHLDLILRDTHHSARFLRFIETYKSQYATTLSHYIQSRKAIAAIDYANAIASQIPVKPDETPYVAARYDEEFEAGARHAAETLVEDALPIYLTNRIVSVVTESLVKEITASNTPAMKELVPNLAEVYVMSDPKLEDNPIIYASEEFYNMSLYGSDSVIGRNCRFLQGPKTPTRVIQRLTQAIAAGEEICETVLNYRRDNTAFLNLLMIAPLYDNKGEVRYFLGCSVDVTALVDGGKGLDSFAQLLAQDHSDSQIDERTRQDPMDLLGELGQMLDEPEANFVRNRLRSNSHESDRSTPQGPKRPTARRFLSMDDSSYGPAMGMGALWPDAKLGHSGRLPGPYRNYLLVRPYPSLRITFTSPALRIPGLLQSKLMDRIGGPEQVRNALLESLSSGASVTAKISWLTHAANGGGENKYITSGNGGGKTRWIHCTPLLGSDEKVGVWMVVLVEEEGVTGMLNRSGSQRSSREVREPMKLGEVGRRGTGNVLYADYLKGGESDVEFDEGAEQRDVDDQFRDFDG